MYRAQMAELVDALVSGTSIERCGGSSPLPGTIKLKLNYRHHIIFSLKHQILLGPAKLRSLNLPQFSQLH
jgi:hypothetical protein